MVAGGIIIAVLVALVCANLIRRTSNAPIDLFWSPLLTSQASVTIFVGLSDNGVTVAPSLQRRLETSGGSGWTWRGSGGSARRIGAVDGEAHRLD